jgi:hypothetical protein
VCNNAVTWSYHRGWRKFLPPQDNGPHELRRRDAGADLLVTTPTIAATTTAMTITCFNLAYCSKPDSFCASSRLRLPTSIAPFLTAEVHCTLSRFTGKLSQVQHPLASRMSPSSSNCDSSVRSAISSQSPLCLRAVREKSELHVL